MTTLGLQLPAAFTPTLPATEIAAHGALIYLALFLLTRVMPKLREGKSAIGDLLFIVIFAELVGKAVSRGAESLADFVLIVLTVMLLRFAVDRMTPAGPGVARRGMWRGARTIRERGD